MCVSSVEGMLSCVYVISCETYLEIGACDICSRKIMCHGLI